MCTIFTIDQPTYKRMHKATEKRLTQDFTRNSDGASVLFLDPVNTEMNTIVRTMSLSMLLGTVQGLMAEASKDARIWIHMRMATTNYVGVGYTHAFDDMNGIVYMHNGIIDNPRGMAVDSFRLAAMGTSGRELYEELFTSNETFANIFRVNTDNYTYDIIRMASNTLYTDEKGNYSTNQCGPIRKLVPNFSFNQYALNWIPPKPRVTVYGNYASLDDYRFDDSRTKSYDEVPGWYGKYDTITGDSTTRYFNRQPFGGHGDMAPDLVGEDENGDRVSPYTKDDTAIADLHLLASSDDEAFNRLLDKYDNLPYDEAPEWYKALCNRKPA